MSTIFDDGSGDIADRAAKTAPRPPKREIDVNVLPGKGSQQVIDALMAGDPSLQRTMVRGHAGFTDESNSSVLVQWYEPGVGVVSVVGRGVTTDDLRHVAEGLAP